SGLLSFSRPVSTVIMRNDRPIWFAASPTPLAAHMVSAMSAANRRTSSVMFFTSPATRLSTSSGYVLIGWIIAQYSMMAGSYSQYGGKSGSQDRKDSPFFSFGNRGIILREGTKPMVRNDRLIQEHVHDPYFVKGKYHDPSVCAKCNLVFHDGIFDWPDGALPNARRMVCPACKRIDDNYEG